MKKISTVAKGGNEIFEEPKLTIGLDLGDRARFLNSVLEDRPGMRISDKEMIVSTASRWQKKSLRNRSGLAAQTLNLCSFHRLGSSSSAAQ
jgi:hypothetical protein